MNKLERVRARVQTLEAVPKIDDLSRRKCRWTNSFRGPFVAKHSNDDPVGRRAISVDSLEL